MVTGKPERNRVTESWEFQLPSSRKLRGFKLTSLTNSNTVTVMVHGWLDNCNSWLNVLPHMENSVGDVITIDLAGHGLSDHLPVDGHYIVMQYALDLSNLLKKLSKSYREIRLVGHSLGAGVCILAERSQVSCLKRASSNIGGPMDFASASTLTTRSTRRRSDGTWSFTHDRRLNQKSIMSMTERQVQEALKKVSTPTLLMIDRGGLWSGLFDFFGPFMATGIFTGGVRSRAIRFFLWAASKFFPNSLLIKHAYNSCVRFSLIPPSLLLTTVVNGHSDAEFTRGHHPHLGEDKGFKTAYMIKRFWKGKASEVETISSGDFT
ncbi:hypothetical protein TrRE_jg13176 [Triparma retinervis]|uniref:AB hydrolase-1 domain-containing protein n=1 Tax=Triparma retinervis TaxID=2557542 RepID=A0A9W6ZA15_9STRA|nr:hypothetical protein TrRE_jg13176 [Triparma retinervis]